MGYAAFALAEAGGRLAGTWLLGPLRRAGRARVRRARDLPGMLCAALAPSIPVVVAG